MSKLYRWILIAVVVVVVVVIAGIAYTRQFANTVTVSQSHTAPGVATASSSPIPVAGTSIFQVVPAQTTAMYSVYENLIIQNKPNNDAVGTTHSVTGSFRIKTGDAPLVAAMNITVDLRTLQTDSSMRDRYVQRNALETDTYPNATFVSVSTQGLPTSYSDGQNVHFQLIGNLTMHGKTNKETFDVQGKVAGNTVTGTATSTIFMTDFGIQPPNLATIAISQNKVLITINFTATQG